MRIFLDTNVLVGALATRGLCADVLREVLARHQLIVSVPLLEELKRVLHQKFNVPFDLISESIDLLQQDAHSSSPFRLDDIEISDKDDLPILSSALDGKAQLFVTGDKELLELGNVKGLEIVTPRVFWEKLRAGTEMPSQ